MSKSYILSRMDWAKAYRDYEVLKVGKENLEVNSDFTKNYDTSKWRNIYGDYNISNNQLKKTVNTQHANNRIEFLFTPSTYKTSDTYTFIFWGEIPTFSKWERFENATILKQETESDFGKGIKKTMVTFTVIDKKNTALLRFYTPHAPVGEIQCIDRYKIVKGNAELSEQWTPNHKDINAHKFPTQVATDIGNIVETTSDKAFNKVVDNAKLNWLKPVNNLSDIPKQATQGDTVMTKSDGKIYRFNGTEWILIQEFDAIGFMNELDVRTTMQLDEVFSRMDSLYTANSSEALTIENYLGNNQNIHPKVLDFKAKWNGYRYWMAYTPYVFGATETENPSLAVSNDMVHWEVPQGVVNPLAPVPEGGYNNDTHLVYRKDLDNLEVWWRVFNVSTRHYAIYRRISKNGSVWSDKELVISKEDTEGDFLSPSVIHKNGKYMMWSCSGTEIDYRESADAKNWTKKTTLKNVWGDLTPWHMDVLETELGYEMIVCAYEQGGNNNTADLYHLIEKFDGTLTTPKKILARSPNPTAPDFQTIYRASFIKDKGMYYIFYSATDNNKRRGIFLTYGTNIHGLNGYHPLKSKRTSAPTGVLENFSATGVEVISITGETTFKNFSGGKDGQAIDVVILGSKAKAIFKNGPNLITPNGKDYVLTPSTMGLRLICTNENTSQFRLVAPMSIEIEQGDFGISAGQEHTLKINSAKYTKIGNKIDCAVDVEFTTVGQVPQGKTITFYENLGFTPATTSIGDCLISGVDNLSKYFVRINKGNRTFYIYEQKIDGKLELIPYSKLQTGAHVIFNISYYV